MIPDNHSPGPVSIQFEKVASDSRLAHFFSTRRFSGDLTLPEQRKKLLQTLYGERFSITVPRQKHGDRIARISQTSHPVPEVDALATDQTDLMIGILVADCFPLLLFDPQCPAVAVIHAGWRGVAADIHYQTVERMKDWFSTNQQHLLAVIGPGIGPCCFQVRSDVIRVFRDRPGFKAEWLTESRGVIRLNLRAVIRSELIQAGLVPGSIHTVSLCTSCRSDLFHSYRRDGSAAGRMLLGAGLIPGNRSGILKPDSEKDVRTLSRGGFPRHLLIEIIDSPLLNDSQLMEHFLRKLASAYHGEILGLKIHQFEPHGLSALMIMPESHVAVHTWPEYGYASLDVFLKRDDDPRSSVPLIKSIFQPEEVKLIELERGVNKGHGTVVHPGLHRKLPDEPQGRGNPV